MYRTRTGSPEFDSPSVDDLAKLDNLRLQEEDRHQIDAPATSINDPMWRIQDELVSVNRANGFHWTEDGIPCAIALIHSEASEALDEDRNRKRGWRDRFAEELADIIIRCLDLGGQLNLPVIETIVAKIEKNRGRGYKHGSKRY